MNYMATLNSLMILAGGRGTRFKEYTEDIPKPMIEVAGKPLIVHIINIYRKFGINNVVILGGYKHEVIMNYFSENYKEEGNQYDFDGIKVTILDTGLDTMTGGRVKKGIEYLDEELFYLTYGDGLADINISELTDFHYKNKGMVTLTAVRPPARFGSLDLDNNKVKKFGEKDNTNDGWINGGFFVVNRKIIQHITEDSCVFEKEPLEEIAEQGDLFAYKHTSFWQCCDTIRELEILESAFENKKIEI
tara:strand:- start:722 stop:1462 length:741 start_codon:yes stop_codon:yes gene_type:complete